MKRWMKQILLLLLVAAMLIALPACNTTPDQGTEDPKGTGGNEKPVSYEFPLEEPVTFTMFSIMNSNVAVDDTWAFQEIVKQTNVQWEVQSVLPVEIQEKKNLLLNGGQYPDVLYKANLTPDELNDYGAEGILIPLNDLIEEYAPNLMAELEKRPGALERITSPDGNIYGLPFLGRNGSGWINSFINQPWLDKLGLEMPTNLEEFYNVMKAFKTQDPNGNGLADEIPLCLTQDFLYYFLPNFDIVIDQNAGSYGMASIDGEYQHLYSSDRYKEFLAYMTKLYDEGLLDPNTFIQNGDQIHAIGASGDTIGFFFDLASYLTVGRERDADFIRVPVFADNVLPWSLAVVPGGLAITDKCENPELVIAWADRFYTQEGGALVFMGVEGKSYTVNEDGTWEWILGEYSDVSELRAVAAIQGSAYDSSVQPDLWFENKADAAEYKFQHDVPTDRELNMDAFPTLSFTESETDELATIIADLDPYIKQYQAQVITGELDLEETWNDYLAAMEKMGLPHMIEIVVAAHNQGE